MEYVTLDVHLLPLVIMRAQQPQAFNTRVPSSTLPLGVLMSAAASAKGSIRCACVRACVFRYACTRGCMSFRMYIEGGARVPAREYVWWRSYEDGHTTGHKGTAAGTAFTSRQPPKGRRPLIAHFAACHDPPAVRAFSTSHPKTARTYYTRYSAQLQPVIGFAFARVIYTPRHDFKMLQLTALARFKFSSLRH